MFRFIKYTLLAVLLGISYSGRAQNQTQYAFRIYLKDKAATPFSIGNPQAYLSQRALQRRNKYHIAIDSSDLPVCKPYIDSILSITGGQLQATSRWQNTLVVLLSDTNVLQQTAALPFVQKQMRVAVYPQGFRQRPQDNSKPHKPAADDDGYYGSAWEQIALCKGQVLHQAGLDGAGMLIAFIDAGFEGVGQMAAFDSLRQRGLIADRWNFVYQDVQAPSEFMHGTQVLSCVSGYLPQTFVGTAPQAAVALYTSEDIRSEQPVEWDNWVAAAERADSLGADIITTSLGYNTFDPPFPDELYRHYDGKSTFVAQAANKAATKGILVVASAGNEGNSPWRYLLTPGDADSALTVGAVDAQNNFFSGSSRGPNADGVVKPDVVAMGVNNAVFNILGTVVQATGTSFATPIIAGLAACLLQKDTMLTPYQLKEIIRVSADHYQQPNDEVGYGLPDFSKALSAVTGMASSPATPSASLSFIIAPNPVQGRQLQIYFVRPPVYPVGITVRDAWGKTMMKANLSSPAMHPLTLSLLPLAQGSYWLTLQDGRQHGTQLFLIP